MFECGTYEYGLKTGDLPEKEMVRIFEKALSKIAGEINDSRIPKKRKLRKITGPFGRSTPDAEPPEYDYIYLYDHRPSNLFFQLYPNREKNGRVKFPEEGIIWNLYFYILPDYPNRISDEDHIQEFGGRVIEGLFLYMTSRTRTTLALCISPIVHSYTRKELLILPLQSVCVKWSMMVQTKKIL